MDSTLVTLGLLAASVVAYITYSCNKGVKTEKILHAEFKALLEPNHREHMAQIMANRDIEIAKATKKEPPPMVQGEDYRLEKE